jgi:hypothetical protein
VTSELKSVTCERVRLKRGRDGGGRATGLLQVGLGGQSIPQGNDKTGRVTVEHSHSFIIILYYCVGTVGAHACLGP